MYAPCKVCSSEIKYRFRAQGLRETVQNVFKVEVTFDNRRMPVRKKQKLSCSPPFQLNFDGNVCCPPCLFALDMCRQLFLLEMPARMPPKKGFCSSCAERTRTSIPYPLEGFTDRLLALPYFQRMQKMGDKARICIKCTVTLEFAKKLAKMIQLNTLDTQPPSLSPAPFPISPPPVVLAATAAAPPSPPPLLLPLPPPPPPLIENSPTPPLIEKSKLSPLPPPAPPLGLNQIKLPRGLTWASLTCYVRLENMRVPPIRIRDLKLLSILKTKSPEKSGKRVSFDHGTMNGPRVVQLGDDSSDEEDNRPLIVGAKQPTMKIKRKKKKKKEEEEVSETVPIAKRPRRLSTVAVSYVEPMLSLLSDSENETVPETVPEKSKQAAPKTISTNKLNYPPPTKRFKVFRPSDNGNEKVQQQKRDFLNTSLPTKLGNGASQPTPPAQTTQSSVAKTYTGRTVIALKTYEQSKKAVLVKRLFSSSAMSPAMVSIPSTAASVLNTRVNGHVQDMGLPWRDERANSVDGSPSPKRRLTRTSIEPPQIPSANGAAVPSTPSPSKRGSSSPGKAAAKIGSRRKTMEPSFMLRVVPLSRLQATEKQPPLLLPDAQRQPVLPLPFRSPSP